MKRTLVAVIVVVGLVLAGALVTAAAPTYIGAAKCKMCHKVEYDSWLAKGTHSQALVKAKASTNPKWDASCMSCHATNKSETSQGVECEACHGPGSDYKAMSIMKDRAKSVAAGLIIQDQKLCDRCHDGKDHHKKVDFAAMKDKVHDSKKR